MTPSCRDNDFSILPRKATNADTVGRWLVLLAESHGLSFTVLEETPSWLFGRFYENTLKWRKCFIKTYKMLVEKEETIVKVFKTIVCYIFPKKV